MRFVYLNPLPNGFSVRVMSGARGDKTTNFYSYEDAVKFATSKMGKTGCVVDYTKVRKPENVPAMTYAPTQP